MVTKSKKQNAQWEQQIKEQSGKLVVAIPLGIYWDHSPTESYGVDGPDRRYGVALVEGSTDF